MAHKISESILTQRISLPAAAGQDPVECQEIDTLGFLGIRVLAVMNQIADGGQTCVKIKGSDTAGNYVADDSDVVATSSALGAADSNKVIVLDIYRPMKRFLKVIIGRGGANAAADGVIAELYAAESAPVQ